MLIDGLLIDGPEHGGCRTEFFWKFPKGETSISPGLRGTSYLGYCQQKQQTPTGFYPMPQSLSSVYLHVVFSTKDRFPFLSDPLVRQEVHSFLGGIAKNLGCPPLLVGGIADHVHVLLRLGRTVSQADLVKELMKPIQG